LTFDKKLKRPKLKVKHSNEVIQKYALMFPYIKFESTTRNLFISTCLFIMFKRTPSSFYAMMERLRDVDPKDVREFLYEIKSYQQNIQLDIDYIMSIYQNNVDTNDVFNEYQRKKIHFYTLWFYIKSLEKHDPERVNFKNSRIHMIIYNKLSSLMLFLKFKPESIEKIEMMYNTMEL